MPRSLSVALLLLVLATLYSAAEEAQAQSRSRDSWRLQLSSTTEGLRDIDTEEIYTWRKGSPYQDAINALGATVVQNLSVPVMGVLPSDLTRNFGDPRSGGRSHEGLDILAPRGTPILSPTNAVVLRVGTGSLSGYYVYTAAPGGETFAYIHLNEMSTLKPGQVLATSSVVGYVGDTGNALGGPTHLHFEIQKDRVATDPYPRLTQTLFATETQKIVSTNTVMPTTDLEFGMRGSGVVWLQMFLISKNVGPKALALASAGATGYFGNLTRAALAEYQKSMSIVPSVGYFGPITRGKIAYN